MQSGPQLEVKRTFLEFDLHTAVKVAGRRRSFSACQMRGDTLVQAPYKSPCECDESDIEIPSTSAGSSRSRTPSPHYSGHASGGTSPHRTNTLEHMSLSTPMMQPCFFWVPFMATQHDFASGVNAVLKAKKAKLGSKVAQLAEAALQAEAAMDAMEIGARRHQGLASSQEHPASEVEELCKTTIMLRNVPRSLTRTMLLSELDSQGFADKFDFVYLPVDFDETTHSRQNFGHAFVNFVCPHDATRARKCFAGFVAWEVDCEKPCETVYREQCQGLTAHIKKYRNSALMHESVLDEKKPIMFADGARCPFPAPTQPIKAPKMRRSPPCQ